MPCVNEVCTLPVQTLAAVPCVSADGTPSSNQTECCHATPLPLLQVPDAYVEGLDLVPNVDKGHLDILVRGNAAAKGLTVGHTVLLSGRFVPCLWSSSLIAVARALHIQKELAASPSMCDDDGHSERHTSSNLLAHNNSSQTIVPS